MDQHTTRQYVAQPPFWGSKVASITTPSGQHNPGRSYLFMVIGVLGFTAVVGGMFTGVQSLVAGQEELVQAGATYGFLGLCLFAVFGGVYAWTWWSGRRQIVVSATSDGLTVNTRPGDVYPFAGAKLGTWGVTGGASMGTALHLQCGERRFILGGRDRRVSSGTRLDAPDAGYGQPIDVDAWVSAEDFEEILAMVSRRSGLDVRPPAQDEPTRCLLFANALKLQEMTGLFKIRKQWEFSRSLHQPRLAIDVGTDGIRVIDPNTGALIAAATTRQVSATPVVYRPTHERALFPSVGNVMSHVATDYWSTSPGMRVLIPGMNPLTIGCRDSVSGLDFRFSWPGEVPVENARADYEVSGMDWQVLALRFGLVTREKDPGQKGAAAS